MKCVNGITTVKNKVLIYVYSKENPTSSDVLFKNYLLPNELQLIRMAYMTPCSTLEELQDGLYLITYARKTPRATTITYLGEQDESFLMANIDSPNEHNCIKDKAGRTYFLCGGDDDTSIFINYKTLNLKLKKKGNN